MYLLRVNVTSGITKPKLLIKRNMTSGITKSKLLIKHIDVAPLSTACRIETVKWSRDYIDSMSLIIHIVVL